MIDASLKKNLNSNVINEKKEEWLGFLHGEGVRITEDLIEGSSLYDPNVKRTAEENTMLFDPIMRKLVNESCCIFLNAQQLRNLSGSKLNSELVKSSRKYRSVLRACIEEVLECMDSEKVKADDDGQYKTIVVNLYNDEFVWHLIEILHIDFIPENIVLPHLIQWISFHYPEYEKSAAEISCNKNDLATSNAEVAFPNFWDTAVGLAMQGNVNMLRTLLRFHSQSDSASFAEMDKILRTMPTLQDMPGRAVHEILSLWNCWQSSVQEKIQAKVFSKEKNLEFIAKIMAGDNLAHIEMRKQCETWYQYMIAHLLYTEPLVKMYDLPFHAEQSISLYGGRRNMKFLDELIFKLMDNDLKTVVNRFDTKADTFWMAAHLTNLLHIGKKLIPVVRKSPSKGKEQTLDESYLTSYSEILFQHRSLWQVALRYLDYCPHRRVLQCKYMTNMELETDTKASKVLEEAKERNMRKVVITVCAKRVRTCLQKGFIVNAFRWAWRSEDTIMLANIADIILKMYMEYEFIASDYMLSSDVLETDKFYNGRLTFLIMYLKLRETTQHDVQAATEIFSKIIESKFTPKYFWFKLLSHVFPLFATTDPPLLSRLVIVEILYTLEELLRTAKDETEAKALANKVELIRHELTKTLSDVYIYEVSGKSCADRIEIIPYDTKTDSAEHISQRVASHLDKLEQNSTFLNQSSKSDATSKFLDSESVSVEKKEAKKSPQKRTIANPKKQKIAHRAQ